MTGPGSPGSDLMGTSTEGWGGCRDIGDEGGDTLLCDPGTDRERGESGKRKQRIKMRAIKEEMVSGTQC